MKYTIVGFDPASTRNIGWSSFSLNKKPDKSSKICSWDGGTLVLPVQDEKWQVLWPMFCRLDDFFEEHNPHLVIVEKTSSFAGGFVTGQVSQCMGVIEAVCGKYDVAVDFVFPTSVKKAVAGHGRAKKTQVKKAVEKHLTDIGIKNIKFHSDHTADAAANVLCWLFKNKVILPKEE